MSRNAGLLADIQAGVVNDAVSVESLLQKCIALGGQAGSVKLRDWARQELNGYSGPPEDFPGYRKVGAQLTARITNHAGYNAITQDIYAHDLPAEVRDLRPNWGVAELDQGVGELETLANSTEAMVWLSPPWASVLVDIMNKRNVTYNSRVAVVYWPISPAALRGVLSRIRTALVELVTELADLTPDDQAVPAREAADQVTQFVITGDRTVITYSPQIAGDHSSNTVTTALGDHATAVGSQSVSGGNNTTGGHDVTSPAVAPAEEGTWWTRLRKRGLFVALATVAAAVIALLAYLGITPSSAPTHPGAPTTTSSPARAAPTPVTY